MKTNEKFQDEMKEEGYFLIPKLWLKAIEETQRKILLILENGGNSSAASSIGDYITEGEAKKLLGRKTTWFWQMRTSGRLPFAKVGNKVFYQKSDIIKLLENNRKGELHLPEQFPLRKAA